MSEAENALVKLANGVSWRMDNLGWMRAALTSTRTKVARVREAIQNGDWESLTADVAASHLAAYEATLGEADAWLEKLETLIPSHAAYVQEIAQAELSQLPMGGLPTAVRDAIDRGQPQAMTSYGLIALGTGPLGAAIASEFFESKRREAAENALIRVQTRISDFGDELLDAVARTFDEVTPELPKQPGEGPERKGPSGPSTPGVGTGPGAPSPSGWTPPGSGGPGGTSGPDGSGPGGNGSGPGGQQPSGPGGSQGPNDPPSGGPDWPHVIADPPIVDPNRPGGDAPGSGDDPHWTDPGRRPSVDSSLDGSTMRSGLGAAGLGAAGLAAGAKLAGSGGGGGLGLGLGAVGPGGLGAAGGPAAGGGGLRGAAAAAGTGGSGASNASSNSSGSGRGARPGGMMMGGGGAGGAAEKKSPKSGLGGYIAPKLEDEGDGGPAARASRAGSRATEE